MIFLTVTQYYLIITLMEETEIGISEDVLQRIETFVDPDYQFERMLDDVMVKLGNDSIVKKLTSDLVNVKGVWEDETKSFIWVNFKDWGKSIKKFFGSGDKGSFEGSSDFIDILCKFLKNSYRTDKSNIAKLQNAEIRDDYEINEKPKVVLVLTQKAGVWLKNENLADTIYCFLEYYYRCPECGNFHKNTIVMSQSSNGHLSFRCNNCNNTRYIPIISK